MPFVAEKVLDMIYSIIYNNEDGDDHIKSKYDKDDVSIDEL